MPGDITGLTEHSIPVTSAEMPKVVVQNKPVTETVSPVPKEPLGKPLRQSEVIAGADANKKVELPPELRKDIGRLLKARQDIIKLIEPEKLSTIDRVISELGDKINNIEAGEITRQEIALSWFVIHDEIILKSADLGKVPQDKIAPGKWNLRNVGKFIIGKGRPEPTSTTDMVDFPGGQTIQQTSELTQLSGRRPEDISAQLKFLNQTRFGIEKALYGKTLGKTSVYPPDLNERSSNLLHGVLRQELERIMQQKYEGKNYESLFREKPEIAIQVMREANTSALTRFADEIGKQHILDKDPKVNTETIKAYAEDLKKPLPKPDTGKLEGDVKTANENFDAAKTKYTEINAPITQAQKDVEQAQEESAQADAVYNSLNETLTADIKDANADIEQYKKMLRPNSPTGNKQEQTLIDNANNNTLRSITELTALRDTKQKELNGYISAKASAEQKLRSKETMLVTREKEALENGLEKAKEVYDQAKAAKDTAEEKLKTEKEKTYEHSAG